MLTELVSDAVRFIYVRAAQFILYSSGQADGPRRPGPDDRALRAASRPVRTACALAVFLARARKVGSQGVSVFILGFTL